MFLCWFFYVSKICLDSYVYFRYYLDNSYWIPHWILRISKTEKNEEEKEGETKKIHWKTMMMMMLWISSRILTSSLIKFFWGLNLFLAVFIFLLASILAILVFSAQSLPIEDYFIIVISIVSTKERYSSKNWYFLGHKQQQMMKKKMGLAKKYWILYLLECW